ncbi:hydrogen peroxide-inducible genes activator [Bdellovibrio sp. NC01]|uniref:hydrogen peroxide-inducible genes activator n=1 Tax=Bdellovibrio sp. NC01 TaxID=2220073 RepID=UPI00115B8D7B|nr:hydrogen peroxide-inducible genes activator [Bdellovibrio sp. NC01]QDK38403.1 hydrogen peroxide-inducible genes activator [Bdellovibrio sp. NC01]
MTLTQLEYILAVADTGSFSHAAQQCHVTQPTLSMQIQKLEEDLGVTLFDRTKQPVRPTALGLIVLKQARLVIQDAAHLKELVNENKGELVGEFRLGIIPTLAPYLLPLFLKKFLAAHPRLQVRIEELETQAMLDKIRNNSIDLGLAVSPIDDVNIAVHPLFYEPFLVYVSKTHPLADKRAVDEKDLSLNDVLLLNEGHCFREQSLALCRKKEVYTADKSFSFESGSLETLKKLVDQGSGFTLLPYLASQDVKDKKRLKEFTGTTPTREVSVLHGPHFQRKALLKALSEEIQRQLPAEVATKKGSHYKAISPL